MISHETEYKVKISQLRILMEKCKNSYTRLDAVFSLVLQSETSKWKGIFSCTTIDGKFKLFC